ncbi:MAG: ATPase [Sulfurimonas sp.]|nr:ATPase [Sulfurimonas sp.]
MLNRQTQLEQFRSFYQDHKPKNFEDAVEKFAIFGGVGWGEIDTSKPTMELIEQLVLSDYTYIRNDVSELTTGMPMYHSILTGIAMGDGKTHTAFRRANVAKDVGEKAIEELCGTGIIRLQPSRKIFTSWSEDEKVSDKLYFSSPFMRFWFAFISPLFKGIKKGDYKEIRERFANRKSEFINLTFEQLSHEFLTLSFKDDPIVEMGSYWDNSVEIDIYAKTKSGKIIAGTCKYTNAKIKKSELTKLQENCQKANIEPDIFVIFSKRGFSSELKTLKGENLKLFTVKNFKKLVE